MERTYNQTPKETEELILKSYLAGNSSITVGKEFGVSYNTVLRVVNSAGRSVRTNKENSKKYDFDEHFFDKIDTEEKAYWYGFILADGCIHRGKDLIITLSKKDSGHLGKFIKSINGNNKIHKGQTVSRFGDGKEYLTEFESINIRSEFLVSGLEQYGMTARKSLTCKPLTDQNIKSNLLPHFWRGVFDGDGHFANYFTKYKDKKYPIFALGLSGSFCVVSGFSDFVFKVLGFRMVVGPDKSIFRCGTSGEKARQISELFYDKSSVYLDRKFKLYQNEREKQRSLLNSP